MFELVFGKFSVYTKAKEQTMFLSFDGVGRRIKDGTLTDEYWVHFDDNDGGCAGFFDVTKQELQGFIKAMETFSAWGESANEADEGYVWFKDVTDESLTVCTGMDGSGIWSETVSHASWETFVKDLKAIVEELTAL